MSSIIPPLDPDLWGIKNSLRVESTARRSSSRLASWQCCNTEAQATLYLCLKSVDTRFVNFQSLGNGCRPALQTKSWHRNIRTSMIVGPYSGSQCPYPTLDLVYLYSLYSQVLFSQELLIWANVWYLIVPCTIKTRVFLRSNCASGTDSNNIVWMLAQIA